VPSRHTRRTLASAVRATGSGAGSDAGGAQSTLPTGINDNGEIVGSFSYPDGDATGFIYKNGVFTQVAATGAVETVFSGVNSSGVICGDSYDGFTTPFTYRKGKFTPFLQDSNSFPVAINARGTVAGNPPFLYQNGSITQIPTNGAFGQVAALNDRGVVVGSLSGTSLGYVGFTYANSQLTTYAVPGAILTFLSGINNHNVAVGGYDDASYNQYAFVSKGGKPTVLPVIGNTYMTPTSINDSGIIAGNYLDRQNATHSFIAEPGGE